MTKDLDQKVAHAMGLKSVNNCEKWGTSMTQDEIMEMAREAHFKSQTWVDIFKDNPTVGDVRNYLVAFANLVAAKEREACAKVCEDRVPVYLKDGERWLKGENGNSDKRLKEIAPNLEGAWEAEQLLKSGSVVEFITEAHKCAAAIRARGEQA